MDRKERERKEKEAREAAAKGQTLQIESSERPAQSLSPALSTQTPAALVNRQPQIHIIGDTVDEYSHAASPDRNTSD